MAVKLGNTTASLYLGNTPVAAYLGAEQVYSAATVPGAPTITAAVSEFGQTEVSFSAPEDDGGSPITGYKFYFDGIEQTPSDIPAPTARVFDAEYAGQELEVSAVNAIGEGPKSDPVTVTAL